MSLCMYERFRGFAGWSFPGDELILYDNWVIAEKGLENVDVMA